MRGGGRKRLLHLPGEMSEELRSLVPELVERHKGHANRDADDRLIAARHDQIREGDEIGDERKRQHAADIREVEIAWMQIQSGQQPAHEKQRRDFRRDGGRNARQHNRRKRPVRGKSPRHEAEIERLRRDHAPVHDVHALQAAEHLVEKRERQVDRERREKDEVSRTEFRAVRGCDVNPVEKQGFAAGKEHEASDPDGCERPDDRAYEPVQPRQITTRGFLRDDFLHRHAEPEIEQDRVAKERPEQRVIAELLVVQPLEHQPEKHEPRADPNDDVQVIRRGVPPEIPLPDLGAHAWVGAAEIVRGSRW